MWALATNYYNFIIAKYNYINGDPQSGHLKNAHNSHFLGELDNNLNYVR